LQLDDVPVLFFCRSKLRIVYAIKMVVQVMIMKIEHLTRGLVGAKTYLIGQRIPPGYILALH
jgi:hypothetical protein